MTTSTPPQPTGNEVMLTWFIIAIVIAGLIIGGWLFMREFESILRKIVS